MDDVDDATKTTPLDGLIDNDAPRYTAKSLESPFVGEPPDAQQVDHVCRGAKSQSRLGLAADDEAAASSGADKTCKVANEVCAPTRISNQHLSIAKLKAHPPRNRRHTSLGPKVKRKMRRQIKRNERDLKAKTGILQRFFRQRPYGDDVVDGCQRRQPVAGGRRVGEEQRRAAEDSGGVGV